jgi:hypothetical protein
MDSGGSVPELRSENLGEKRVLLFDGEELIGAKQNRDAGILCEGRPLAHAKRDFQPTQHVMHSRARAARRSPPPWRQAVRGGQTFRRGSASRPVGGDKKNG